MASNINLTNIDTTYPIAGQDNDSQGFRDNFTNINTNFTEAKTEIEALQSSTSIANYDFKTDQIPTVTEDNWVLTYNNSTGLISLEVNASASATETNEGIIELATQAEVDAGSDAVRAVTPATLAAKPATPELTTDYGTTGAQTLDTAAGTFFTPTGATTGIITFTFTNPAAVGTVTAFTMVLNDAGTNAPVWPASVDWPAATEPTWSAGGIDIVSFITTDNGTTWYGMLGGLAFA